MSLNPMDWIKEGLNYFLYNFVYILLYDLEIAICKALDWLQELMDIFTGTAMVSYKYGVDTDKSYLINIFFRNGAVSGVYWGMAAIGVVMAFFFAIISVVRKTFDIDDKVKMSLGQILNNLLKSILLIISLNVGMSVIITGTNLLMERVVFVFDHANDIANGNDHIEYTDEQYAAMARIFNTIGNYSLNPSYKNRYNINACYNEIRGDLSYLDRQGVFDFYYETIDENNNVIVTWQSLLQEVANAADFNREVAIDVYNEGIANALYHVMEEMRNNPSIAVLKSYDRIENYSSDSVSMGTTMFVIGTMGNGLDAAAKNSKYNEHPSLTDAVRAPYYRGIKSVYKIKEVNQDFDIAFSKTNYLIVYLAGGVIAAKMALIIVTCVARIFNLIFLYVIAPPVFAVMPLDDGGKVKQWLTAFLVQAFSVFATVISMRLYLLFLPIILDPDLILSENIIIDMVGRVVMIFAGIEAISKANGILTGILADNAGWQSISSGDMSGYLRGSFVGRMASRASSYTNSLPARAIGGQKLANFLDGKQNPANAQTGGALGAGMSFMRNMFSAGIGGIKSGMQPYKSLFQGGNSGGQNDKGGAGGSGGSGGSGNSGKPGGPGAPGGGGKGEGKEAAIPPPQRNMGGK